ncbi:MAG: DEAD/DEAH box helicase [Nitrospinae bacterium]|nr:DEAD/DEAH box helicase [Nitrospinota bacterium]
MGLGYLFDETWVKPLIEYLQGHTHTSSGIRGREYFLSGRVMSIDIEDEDSIIAAVRGNEIYETRLLLDDVSDTIDGVCSCPVGNDCKHCVAAAFTAVAFARLAGSAYSQRAAKVLGGAAYDKNVTRKVDAGKAFLREMFPMEGDEPVKIPGAPVVKPAKAIPARPQKSAPESALPAGEWWKAFIESYGTEQAKQLINKVSLTYIAKPKYAKHEFGHIASHFFWPENPVDFLRRFEENLHRIIKKVLWRDEGITRRDDGLRRFLESPEAAAAATAWDLRVMERTLSQWVRETPRSSAADFKARVVWLPANAPDHDGLEVLNYRLYFGWTADDLRPRALSGIQRLSGELEMKGRDKFTADSQLVHWIAGQPEVKNNYGTHGGDNTLLPLSNAVTWLNTWGGGGKLFWEDGAPILFEPLSAKLSLVEAGEGKCQWAVSHPALGENVPLSTVRLIADHQSFYSSRLFGHLFVRHNATLFHLDSIGMQAPMVVKLARTGAFPISVIKTSPIAPALIRRMLQHGAKVLIGGAVSEVRVKPVIELHLDEDNMLAVVARAVSEKTAFCLNAAGEWEQSGSHALRGDAGPLLENMADAAALSGALPDNHAGNKPGPSANNAICLFPVKADLEEVEKWLGAFIPNNAKEAFIAGQPGRTWKVKTANLMELIRQWEARPRNASYLGTKAFRELVTVRPAPHISVQAEPSGMNWLALSVELEEELKKLTPADLLARLTEGDEELVSLPSGVYRRGDLADYYRKLDAFASAGIALDGKPQKIHALQFAGDKGRGLLEMAGHGAEMGDFPEKLNGLIKSFKKIPSARIGADAARILRDYQKEGVDFLAWAADTFGGALLADEMGLGKTLQMLLAITALKAGKENAALPSLIICPASVQHNWRREAEHFVPHLKVGVLESGKERYDILKKMHEYDVLVKNYSLTRRDQEILRGQKWLAICVDEAQAIKNPAADISKVVKTLDAKYRFALTGTPIENRVSDICSIVDFAVPGYLPASMNSGRMSGEGGARDAAFLRARLRPILLRRLKSEVAAELPPRIEERLDCAMTPAQKKVYLAEAAKARHLLGTLKGGKTAGQEKIIMLAALTRLRQICCDPGLIQAEETGSGKVEEFMGIVAPLVESGKKVLVFSQFVRMLNRLEDRLMLSDIPCRMLTGQTKRRSELVEDFEKDAEPSVFLISLKAGGTGLNLVSASHVVLFDPWWNPAVEAQAIDRTHRIGQTKTVLAFRLVTLGTIEEKILELQEKKRRLVKNVLEEESFNRGLTKEDFAFLLEE